MTLQHLSEAERFLYLTARGALAHREQIRLTAGLLAIVRADLHLEDDPHAYAVMRGRLQQLGATEADLAGTAFEDCAAAPTPWSDGNGDDPMEPER